MTYPAAVPEKPKENPVLMLAILLALLAGLSFVLVHFNIISCGFYSEVGCDMYYSIIAGGKPKVLIVYGEEGMGDPQFLAEVLKGTRFDAKANIRELSLTTLPLLTEYQLVVVERARRMSTSQIKMFQEYAGRGGRLVWVGDAGTLPADGETDMNIFLLKGERKTGASRSEYLGPWARKQGDKQVSLDYTLGVRFRGNYCEMVQCTNGVQVGNLDFPDPSSRLANGLSQGLAFYGDFSIVELNDSSYQKSMGILDYGTNLIATPPSSYFWLKTEKQGFGKNFPVIVATGFGGRVAYYAFPPEFFVSEKMPMDRKTGERVAYWALIENMYYGMLYK